MNKEQFENLTYLLHHKWDYMGVKNVKGAVLLAHVPSVAEEAWMHEIYEPLNENSIEELEEMLEVSIPEDLRMLYTFSNGLNLFNDYLAIYGLKTSYDRTGDLYEPYNIVSEQFTRPKLSPDEWFYFGNLNDNLLFYNLKSNKEKVYLTDREEPLILQEWENLYDFLSAEIERLNELHDEQGRMPGVKYISDILREIEEEKQAKKRKKKK